MAIYLDKDQINDIEAIDGDIIDYIIKQRSIEIKRLDNLKKIYMGKNLPKLPEKEGKVELNFNYARYIVNILLGMYLGDPVKYIVNEQNSTGQDFKLNQGQLLRVSGNYKPKVDISPILDLYKKQTIAEHDARIGKDIGIYGEAYELIYASGEEIPSPRSTIVDPRACVMVRDDTVEHSKLFFMTFSKKRDFKLKKDLYKVIVYTDTSITTYKEGFNGKYELYDKTPHYFKEVPVVEYQNNSDEIGDFEPVLDPMEAYNQLMSDRITDKNMFIDSLLAIYGAVLDDELVEEMEKSKTVSLPEGSKVEYVQKTFNESEIHILSEDIIKQIHKLSLTVDLTDENFAGNASGQALKLKLLAMTMQVKNKIRQLEKGLKKRFEIYNNFLNIQSNVPIYGKDVIEPIFTISLPIDEMQTVSIVKNLQGIVDDEQLLSLLWFVKDPKDTIEKVKAQKLQNSKDFSNFSSSFKKEEEKEEENNEENEE